MKSAWMATGILFTLLAAPLAAQAHDRHGDRHHGYHDRGHYGYYDRGRHGYCTDHRHKRWKRHYHRYHSDDHRGWDRGGYYWSGHGDRRDDRYRHDGRRGGW